jgi:hypothetical protein
MERHLNLFCELPAETDVQPRLEIACPLVPERDLYPRRRAES